MHMKNEIYSSCATFTCKCCSYEDEIYSDIEFLDEYIDPKECVSPSPCHKCGMTFKTFFDPGVIFRPDSDESIKLHPQCASLPHEKSACQDCLDAGKIHWIALEVYCPKCDAYSMLFSQYTKGVYMEQFKQWVCENAKPKVPDLGYTINGITYYGPLSDFKAN